MKPRRQIATLAISLASFLTRLHIAQAESQPLDRGADETQELALSRGAYRDQLHGFWLGQSIANWTGLVTEMVKVKAPFYTDQDWGKPADRAI